MTRRTLILRSWVLMLGLLGITAFVAPTAARAQYDCKCDYATIYVGDVNCKFDICVKDVTGGFNCYTVGPGSTIKVKCPQAAAFLLKDCNGNLIEVTDKCVQCVCLGNGCCVDACLGRDADGCLYVKIGPSACKCICKCP